MEDKSIVDNTLVVKKSCDEIVENLVSLKKQVLQIQNNEKHSKNTIRLQLTSYVFK